MFCRETPFRRPNNSAVRPKDRCFGLAERIISRPVRTLPCIVHVRSRHGHRKPGIHINGRKCDLGLLALLGGKVSGAQHGRYGVGGCRLLYRKTPFQRPNRFAVRLEHGIKCPAEKKGLVPVRSLPAEARLGSVRGPREPGIGVIGAGRKCRFILRPQGDSPRIRRIGSGQIVHVTTHERFGDRFLDRETPPAQRKGQSGSIALPNGGLRKRETSRTVRGTPSVVLIAPGPGQREFRQGIRTRERRDKLVLGRLVRELIDATRKDLARYKGLRGKTPFLSCRIGPVLLQFRRECFAQTVGLSAAWRSPGVADFRAAHRTAVSRRGSHILQRRLILGFLIVRQ